MSSAALSSSFSGIWPALMTPLASDLSIDHARWVAHARRLLDAGCGGITPFGTTGEGPSFSVDERRAAVDALVAGGVPAARIIVSTSAAALPDVVALTRHALALGAHGCLMLPPFYFKGPDDAGVIDAYRQVIDAVADARLRLYLYHIPQVSAVALSHPVIDTLRRAYPGIVVGIKDSECRLEQSLALADAFMPGLMVYVGNELDLPALGRRGSSGAISGLANFMPRTVRSLVAEPDAPATAHKLERTRALLAHLGTYALIPALKSIMATLDAHPGWRRVRAPLRALDDGQHTALAARLKDFGIGAGAD